MAEVEVTLVSTQTHEMLDVFRFHSICSLIAIICSEFDAAHFLVSISQFTKLTYYVYLLLQPEERENGAKQQRAEARQESTRTKH